MDDFKRFYSNNDEEKSVPYFWEKFDADNYSIWFGEYKLVSFISGKIFISNFGMDQFGIQDPVLLCHWFLVCDH